MSRILFVVLSFCSFPLMADQWSFPAEIKIKAFEFGDLTIERTIDTRNNQQYPLYQIKVFRGDEELANYRNLTFEFIQPFDNGNFVFAGTNSGISRFAYFVLDKDGGLIMAQVHSDTIPYCEMTVSIVREWLPEKIEIKEEYEEIAYEWDNETVKYFAGAQVKTCGGKYIDILN